MCLIIARQRGTKEIPSNYIENAVTNNPDGFGIVGKTRRNEIIVEKDLAMKNCLDLIRQFEKDDLEFIAHFRYRTHGEIDEENTHPFQLIGKNYMCHNGTINIDCSVDKSKSDTWHFARKLRLACDMNVRSIKAFLSRQDAKMLGASKLAFLGSNLPLTIYNEALGKRIDGVWYSNTYSIEDWYSSRYSYRYSWDDWSMKSEKSTKSRWSYTSDAVFDELSARLDAGQLSLQEMSDLDVYTLADLIESNPFEVAYLIKDITWVK